MFRFTGCTASILILLIFTPVFAANNPAVTISVDASLDNHAINPLIYGVNFGNSTALSAMNATCNRYGGNRTSRYNYSLNVDHTGEFWYWESYPDANSVGGLSDALIDDSQTAGAEPLITVSMLDYIAKTDGSRHILCSFPKSVYNNQDDYSPDCTLNPGQDLYCCGNGNIAGVPIAGADPTNASTANSIAFETGFVDHMINKYGLSGAGGVKYYILDNEHGIWHQTHRDVRPTGVTMATIWQRMRDYSLMIKGEDAGAKILAPEEFGWTGYFYSGSDIQQCDATNCWGNPPDWLNNCGNGAGQTPCAPIDYAGWVLDQFHNYDTANNKRLLDVFTLHIYPQGDGTHDEFTSDTSTATQNLRNRSTRSLWDPNYVDQSWIGTTGIDNGVVKLIPRMKQWVADHYPGTLIGITEYHWGPTVNSNTGDDHIYSAITEADVLGIFGREGLDIANLYVDAFTNPNLHIASAFKMYRNYDGAKSTFGETNVRDSVPDAQIDNVSSFAALRNDGALTIMAVHKYTNSNNTPITVNLANFATNGTAQVWRLNSNNTISHLADKTGIVSSFTDSLPPQTVTMYIVQPAAAAPGYSVSCSPTALFAAPGAGDTSTCTVSTVGGFNSDVTLSCAGLPAGITCSFDNSPISPTPGSSGLTVNVDNAVADGSYPFTVDGTDGVTPHSQNMSITVSSGPAPKLFDDFADGIQSWPTKKGLWVESGGELTGTGSTTAIAWAPQPWFPSGESTCSTCTLETDVATAGGLDNKIFLQPWYQDKLNRVDVILKEEQDKIIVKHISGGTIVAKDKAFVTLDPNTNYHIKVGYDGANINLEVDGNLVLSLPDGVAPSGNLWLKVKNTTATFQGVIIY